MFNRPGMWASELESFELQMLLLIEIREFARDGYSTNVKEIYQKYIKDIRGYYTPHYAFSAFSSLDDLSDFMKPFINGRRNDRSI